jgi:transcriptional regulator GlxA family with amidase domain
VRTVRLEAAARLMVAGGVKLARIAEATGFADAFHLSHAFKAHFGASPRAYRERAARV